MQQDPNYGRPEEPQSPGDSPVGGPIGNTTGTRAVGMSQMSAQDEQTWSMVAHLTVLLDIVTGIGGPIAALVIWLVYKDKSQRVAFHALQSLWYQVAWIVIIFAYVVVSTILTIVVIGIFMFFLLPLIALVPIVHQCYAAYKVSQGVDYRYPVIADMIDQGRRVA
ncbi:MAG: uncharacterized protein QOI57_2334 [Rubrobacteraceae bacterium]|jgi:uncharacterized Tic20 family protein|nr:uncharacterized protein [Rubrobacteraceae bacterium]